MMPTARTRLALAFQGACVSAVGLYAVFRWSEGSERMEAHRVASFPIGHAGYFWRAWTVAYAGIMCGFLVFGAARTYGVNVCRTLVWALYAASALLALQTLFEP